LYEGSHYASSSGGNGQLFAAYGYLSIPRSVFDGVLALLGAYCNMSHVRRHVKVFGSGVTMIASYRIEDFYIFSAATCSLNIRVRLVCGPFVLFAACDELDHILTARQRTRASDTSYHELRASNLLDISGKRDYMQLAISLLAANTCRCQSWYRITCMTSATTLIHQTAEPARHTKPPPVT
jgi:hypothetical protein